MVTPVAATAMKKLLAKLAVDAAVDAEKRRQTLALILAPAIGFLLLVAFIVYIITSPLSLLCGWLSPDEASVVEDFQKGYGYNQNIGIYENDYVEEGGRDYGGVVFTGGAGDVTYYSQMDGRWADTMYGASGTIGSAGCGPTSMSIVISTLTGEAHGPVELAAWSVANGHRCEGNGSYHTLIPESAKAYGLPVEGAGKQDGQKIVDALSSGKLVVAIMSKGHFTSGGHFIVLRGVTAGGKILVADPASHSRSEKEWGLPTILGEARTGAEAGGPFWIIGR